MPRGSVGTSSRSAARGSTLVGKTPMRGPRKAAASAKKPNPRPLGVRQESVIRVLQRNSSPVSLETLSYNLYLGKKGTQQVVDSLINRKLIKAVGKKGYTTTAAGQKLPI